MFGKAKRRPHRSHTSSITSIHVNPGDGVSADQFEAGVPGIVPTTKGLPTSMTYKFCNFWIDHSSKFLYVTMHPTKDSKELLRSKSDFESFSRQHGVNLCSFRADNGVYASASIRASCSNANQSLTYCGVGSHWQNGLAERAIGTIQATARTILLHAMAKWPGTVTEAFWPFAINHAVHLYNISSRDGPHKSPWELFTGTPLPKHPSDSRVFGCPAFVLHKVNQDNPAAAKTWASCCWQGVYIGHSPLHASSVALIYNPSTRHVTPQFHVTFDKEFSTVHIVDLIALEGRLEKLHKSNATWSFTDSHGDLAPYFFDTGPNTISAINPVVHSATPINSVQRPLYRPVSCSLPFRHWKAKHNIAAELYHCPSIMLQQATQTPRDEPSTVPPSLTHAPSGMSSIHHDPVALTPNTVSSGDPASPPGTGSLPFPRPPHASVLSRESHTDAPLGITPIDPTLFASLATPSEGAFNVVPPPIMQHTMDQNDTLMQTGMLSAPGKDKFIAAQVPEIRGLHQQGVFTYHKVSDLPPRARLLNAIWSYKRKCTPTGTLSKYKSRLCTDGSQQRAGVDYTKTYAPVVSWGTVRLVLALATMPNLHSRQVDFTQAFTQSPIDTDVFMRIPQGWYYSDGDLHQHPNPRHRDTDHYIRLAKTLYGVKQAARQWYLHLKQGLLNLGFTASAIDPCLFIRDNCLILLYVDDCLIFSQTTDVIDDLLNTLQSTYVIGEQGTVQDFLGLRISTDSDGALHFQQEGLINSIISDLHLTDSASKPTPAVHVLHPDERGAPREELWNYRSIIGKLNFLAHMTRPDISMAVHNCARFSAKPTSLHEQAIKRIGHYLAHTRNKGLIYRPDGSNRLDMYVDANFAGTWHREYAHLRGSCLSRTGFVVIYNGCPIHWGSKLQSEIALSTTEAKYIALSTALRDLLPLRRILHELRATSFLPSSTIFSPSTIYEDNASCIALAHRETQLRPRTKHIALKFHHFRDNLADGTIRIEKVASASNWADIFTKPLTQFVHERLRRLMMGW